MNNSRRKQIDTIIEELETIKERIVDLNEVEQDIFDNMPEGFQESEKAKQFRRRQTLC